MQVVQAALAAGINWFDTAATYSEGRSEAALGFALRELGAVGQVHLATKVRLPEGSTGRVRDAILTSVEASLRRFQCSSVTLLQLHNSITPRAGDQPTSVTVETVLGPGGVLETFLELQASGQVRFLGLTGLGAPQSVKTVLSSGGFDTVQTPYNLLNPSAGQVVGPGFLETDYANQFATCHVKNLGVFAIRVLAGGALAGNAPSAHTQTTRFFPLDLYERDQIRAAEFQRHLPPGRTLKTEAIQFAIRHPAVASALVGFATPEQVTEAVESLNESESLQ